MLLLQQLQQAGMVLLQQQAGMLLLHQAGMLLVDENSWLVLGAPPAVFPGQISTFSRFLAQK